MGRKSELKIFTFLDVLKVSEHFGILQKKWMCVCVCVCVCVLYVRVFSSTFSGARINRFEWFKKHSIPIDSEKSWLVFGKGRSSRFGDTEQRVQKIEIEFLRERINRFEWFKKHSIPIDREMCWLVFGKGRPRGFGVTELNLKKMAVFERTKRPI